MAIVTTTAKSLYGYEEVSPNVYQQVAYKKGKIHINDHFKLLTKGERGGLLRLSKNKVIQAKQKRDINLSNTGKLTQNTWLSKDSSLNGDFKLPLNSLIMHSQINAKNQHSVLIDSSYFNHTGLSIAPDTSVSIIKSELINSSVKTKPSKEEQVLFINNSSLNKTRLLPENSSQMIVDSILSNVHVRGNSDIDASCLEMKKQSALLNNTSAHGSDVMLDNAVLIISDSDIQEQKFTDKQAINGYLVIKNDQIRGERQTQSASTKTKSDQTELDL